MEQLFLKRSKANLDVTFLRNCQNFRVFPKFLSYNLPHSNAHDTKAIRKRLLRGALRKREAERRKLDQNLSAAVAKIRCALSGLDWFIVKRCILKNVKLAEARYIGVHDKKLRALTKNSELPFSEDEILTNLSGYKLSKDEAQVLGEWLELFTSSKEDFST